MKSIQEEYEKINRDYKRKIEALNRRANQPMSPQELAAWKARRRNKIIVIWSVYAAIVWGLIKFSLWMVKGYGFEAQTAAIVIVGIPCSLVILKFAIQLTKVILSGVESWWNILRYGVPLGEWNQIPIMTTEEWMDWARINDYGPYRDSRE